MGPFSTIVWASILAGTCTIASSAYAGGKGPEEDVFATSSVSDNDLENERGASLPDDELTAVLMEATSANNVAKNTETGSNAIMGDALGHAQGLVNVIQNTGNNVVIQSATVVNVRLNDH